nr:helix-turn-helix domain-containing protein [uncultured Blautia sp.]
MEDKKIVTPVQPYLTLDAEDYQEILNRRMGISSFYEFNVKNGNSGNFRAVPDGSTDLVFGIGEKDVKVLVGGTVLKAKDWEFDDGRYYFGARFLPGKCILPKSLSIKEVVNADVEIGQNEYGSGLTESLAEASDVKQRAQILMQYLSNSQKENSRDSAHVLEEYMRQRIYATDGNISIQMLSRETGYSECYIRRVFKEVHGISPKEFERFIRFQAFLGEITRSPDQAGSEEMALNCGYYDQSHMLKDFRAFAGTTPEKYKKYLTKKAKDRSKNPVVQANE